MERDLIMDNPKSILSLAIITKLQNIYCVEFPNLPGCLTQGDSFEDAVLKAQEALAIYYYQQGEILNKEYDIFDLQKSNPNSIIQMIVVDPSTYRLKLNEKSSSVVKKTLTIPEWLDTISKKYPINYSAILKQALIEHLKNYDGISKLDKMMLDN